MVVTSFNRDWTFYNEQKKGKEILVHLPHDAMLYEKRLAGMQNGAAAGFYPGGKYVYCKKMFGEKEYESQTVLLEFEGVYMRSTVLLNNEIVGGHIYGYTGFYVDLTDKLRIGEDNEIKVIADNSRTPNARWYTGSGIYRSVNLIVGNKKHILPSGIRVQTKSCSPAVLSVDVEVSPRAAQAEIRVEVCERSSGKIIATAQEGQCEIEIPGAKLWDAEHPNLYEVRVQLLEGGQLLDSQSVTTGIRMLGWNAEEGFLVNGVSVKLRGGCIHHDNGFLGACAYKKAEYRKIALLKKAGFNAIRSSHNPCSKYLLDACDALGMYVMDEAFDQWQMKKTDYDYGLYFNTEWINDLQAMIRKDWNHPSVVMYSIGNEIGDTGTVQGANINKELADFCRRLDSTRPVANCINPVVSVMGGMMNNSKTSPDDVVNPYAEKKNAQATASLLANMIATAVPMISNLMGKPKKVEKKLRPCFEQLDIVGYNYAERCYEVHHEYAPQRVMIGSETYPHRIGVNWEQVMKHSYLIGDFMWTAWDYLGEAGVGVPIYGKTKGGFNRPYPCLAAGCGAIDLTGMLDASGQYVSVVWEQRKKPYIGVRPVNHSGEKYFLGSWRNTDVISSWSFAGHEGKTAQIEVYSMGDQVELLQDGQSLGRKTLIHSAAAFETIYRQGTLTAISYDGNGEILAKETLKSAGEQSVLAVNVEESNLQADGQDLAYVNVSITDTQGIVKVLENTKVCVSVSGAATLVAVGSANPITEESFTGNSYTTYMGRMQCILRNNGTKGLAKVQVSADGFATESLVVKFA